MADNVMDKYVKKSTKKERNTRQNSGRWLTNVLKSFGYSSFDILTDLMPASMDTAKTTATLGQDLADSLRNIKQQDRPLKRAIEKNFYVGLGKDFLKNSLEDLKTGKFYNKERQEAFFASQDDDFGDFDFGDFGDEDFDSFPEEYDDFSDSVESSDGNTRASFSRKKAGSNEVTQINVVSDLGPDSSIVQATNFQTETNVNVGKAVIENSKIQGRQFYHLLGRIENELNSTLVAMGDNVAQLTPIVTETLSQHNALASKFFDDSIALQQQILEELKNNGGRATDKFNTREFKEYNNTMDIFTANGAVDAAEYKKLVKKQTNRFIDSNMFLSQVKFMGENKEALQMYALNPLQTALEGTIKTIVPKMMKTAMQKFDKQLGETFIAGLNQVSGLQRSSNPILSALGSIFGVQNKITLSRIDKSSYNKGAMSWTGLDHQAVTNVIPTLLRKIYASVSGTQEIAFDYENGIWRQVADIEKENKDRKTRMETSGFSEYKSGFSDFLNENFAMTPEDKKKYKETFEKFISSLVRDSYGGRTFRLGGRGGKETDDVDQLRDDIKDLLGAGTSDDTNVQLIRAYLSGLEKTNKGALTSFFGRSVQEQRATIDRQMKEMQNDPTRYNTMYMDTGLSGTHKTDAHLEFKDKNDKRKATGVKSGVAGGVVDEYKKSTNYYLRQILSTLVSGIYVMPITSVTAPPPPPEPTGEGENPPAADNGGYGYNTPEQILERLNANRKRVTGELRDSKKRKDEINRDRQLKPSSYTDEKKAKDVEKGKIDLDDGEHTLAQILAVTNGTAQAKANEETVEEKTFFGKLLDMVPEDSGLASIIENINKGRSKAGEKGAGLFDKATTTLFDIVFGTEDGTKGFKALFHKAFTGLKAGFLTFASFLDEKVLKPLNDALFGEDGLITKLKQSEFAKALKDKFASTKDKVSTFLFGEKTGPDGEREGGVFSDALNAFKDIGTNVKEGLFGAKGADGKPLPLEQDNSVFGSIKRFFKDGSDAVKDALGVDKDKKFSSRLVDTLDAGFDRIKERSKEWSDNIFGQKDENGEYINGVFSTEFVKTFKSDMKGNAGYIGATASVGLLGSLFLPGGPIGGALIGAGFGIVKKSTGLQDALFGPEVDGERTGGLISSEFQKFFNDHKMGAGLGATAGTLASFGILPSFFLPGGPIGGALIGTGLSIIKKSGAFDEVLFGTGGTKEDPTGGLLGKLKSIFGKDKNFKTLGLDVGIGAGVGVLGSFFLPGGPILHALLGSALSVGTATEKFKTWFFGEDDGTGKRKGGILGRFTKYTKDKIFDPLGKSIKLAQSHVLEFVETEMVAPFKWAMKPLMKGAEDAKDAVKEKLSNLFDGIKEKFSQTVIKPIGDTIDKFFLSPLKKLLHSIFSGLGNIVGSILSAPFKLIGAFGWTAYEQQKKRGKEAYIKENGGKGVGGFFKRTAMRMGIYDRDDVRNAQYSPKGANYEAGQTESREDRYADYIADIKSKREAERDAIRRGEKPNKDKDKNKGKGQGKSGSGEGGPELDTSTSDEDIIDELLYGEDITRSERRKRKRRAKRARKRGISGDALRDYILNGDRSEENASEEGEGGPELDTSSGTNAKSGEGTNENANDEARLDTSSDDDIVNDLVNERGLSSRERRKRKKRAKDGRKLGLTGDDLANYIRDGKTKSEEGGSGSDTNDEARLDTSTNAPNGESNEGGTGGSTTSASEAETEERKRAGNLLDKIYELLSKFFDRFKDTTEGDEGTSAQPEANGNRPNTPPPSNDNNDEARVDTSSTTSADKANKRKNKKKKSKPSSKGDEGTSAQPEANGNRPNTPPPSNDNNDEARVDTSSTTSADKANKRKNKKKKSKPSSDNKDETTLDTSSNDESSEPEEKESDAEKAIKGSKKNKTVDIAKDVSRISDSVYGQLNGVGRNVNKIYKLLLKHFNETDDNIEGDDNKAYMGLLGRIRTALNNPIKAIKRVIMAPFNTLWGVVKKVKNIGSYIVTGIKNIGGAILGGLSGVVKGIGKIAGEVIKLPFDIVHTGLSLLRDMGPALGQALVATVSVIGTAIETAGSVINTSVQTVGNVLVEASKGLGTLIGGAMTGLGNLLGVLGLVGKDVLKGAWSGIKVAAKGIGAVISAPFKLLGGGLKGIFPGGKAKHVIVDGGTLDKVKLVNYVKSVNTKNDLGLGDIDLPNIKIPNFDLSDSDEEDDGLPHLADGAVIPPNHRFLAELGDQKEGLNIEAPLDTIKQGVADILGLNNDGLLHVIVEGGKLDEVEEVGLDINQGSNDVNTDTITSESTALTTVNPIRNQLRAKDEEEREEQVERGSRVSVLARINESKALSDEATFRNDLLAVLDRTAVSTELHKESFFKVFDIKKGLITTGLILLAPYLFKLLTKFDIGGLLSSISENLSTGFAEVGGAAGIANNVVELIGNGKEVITGKDTHYQVDDDGNLVYDEDGNLATETTKASRTKEFISPIKTRIDTETGEWSNERRDSTIADSRDTFMANRLRRRANKAIKIYNKVKDKSPRFAQYVENKGSSFINFASEAGESAKDTVKGSYETAKNIASMAKEKIANSGVIDEIKSSASIAKNKVKTTFEAAKGGVQSLASDSESILGKAIEFMSSALDSLVKKISSLGKRFGVTITEKELNISNVRSLLTVSKLKPLSEMIGKFLAKISAKTVASAATFLLSDIGFALVGAVSGASNPGTLFEVDSKDVDFKMRAIAGVFKGLLSTTLGSWVDLINSVVYEIQGTNFVKVLATHVYKLLSSDDKYAELEEAQKDFTDDYESYVSDEYDAYVADCEENGTTPMSEEEFKASDLVTTRSEYVKKANPSLFTKVKNFITGKNKKSEKSNSDDTTLDTSSSDDDGESKKGVIATIADTIKTGIGGMTDYGTKVKDFVKRLKTYTDPNKSISGWANETMSSGEDDYLGDIISALIKKLMALYVAPVRGFKSIFSSISEKVSSAKESVSSFFDTIGTKIKSLFGKGGDVYDGGRPIYGKGDTSDYTYYSQNDPAYKNESYNGTGDTIGDSGCGPTAMAMVASRFTGNKDYNPLNMAKMSEAGGYSSSLGTSPEYFSAAANTLGIPNKVSVPSSDSIQASLSNGNSIILQGVKSNGTNSPFTSQGHYVVVDGMKGDKVLVSDPRGEEYTGLYNLNDVMTDATGMWSFGGGYGSKKNKKKTAKSILKKLKKGGKGADSSTWVSIVKAVKKAIAAQKPGYSQTNFINITVGGRTIKVRTDCSGFVSACLKYFGVLDEGTNLQSALITDQNNATMKATGFTPMSWQGWDALQEGDIIALNGHTEIFAYNDGNSHYVYNCGSNSSVNNPDATYTAHKEGYKTVWRCGGAGSTAVSSTGVDSTSDDSSTSSGGVSSLSELLSGAADAASNSILTSLGIKVASDDTSTDSTSTDGSTSVASAEGITGSTNAEKVWNYFTKAGYSKAATAAILGNGQQESGLNPASDSGAAHGMFQWESGRFQSLKNYASNSGRDWKTVEPQVEYLNSELPNSNITYFNKSAKYGSTAPYGAAGKTNWEVAGTTKTTYDAWKNSTDVDTATRQFEAAVERASLPRMDNRIKYAKGFYDLYAGKGGEAGDGGKPIIEGKGSSVSSTSSSMSETLDSAKQMVNNVIATGSASSETVLQLIKIAIEYLSAIADNTGDTSDGIDELNKKSVNMINNTTNNTTNNNVVNNTNSNSTTGSTEDKSADRSKYSMAKRIAAGILT